MKLSLEQNIPIYFQDYKFLAMNVIFKAFEESLKQCNGLDEEILNLCILIWM